MIVRKKVYRKVHVETGETMTIEVLTADRKNQKTTCNYCSKKITDETFLAAITKIGPNYFFHRCCYPQSCFDAKIWKNGDPECAKCGHPYHRHYDLYEKENDPDSCFFAGCKYCGCDTWKPKEDWKYPE